MTGDAVELAQLVACGLPAAEVVVGTFSVDVTRPTAPVFLRLAPESGEVQAVDGDVFAFGRDLATRVRAPLVRHAPTEGGSE